MTDVNQERLLQDGRWLCIQLEQCVSRRLSSLGITAVQAHILLFLLCRGDQGTVLTDIHRAFGYSKATLSGMVKRLREKGYVRTERCQGDDRRRLLFATDSAKQMQPQLEAAIGSVHGRLYEGFSPEELCTLARLQRRLLQNLSVLITQSQKEEATS